MTGRDKFPFGKYGPPPKGLGLTLQQVKDDHLDYIDWLRDQEWASPKWDSLLDWFDCGDSVTSSVDERKVIDAEVEVLKGAPESFKHWWTIAYGERLRKSGEQLYIPYLRVALTAWLQAEGLQIAARGQKGGDAMQPTIGDPPYISRQPKPSVPAGVVAPAPRALPSLNLPPLKPAVKQPIDTLDEDVPF